jgi:glutaredoxin 3
VDTVAHVEVYSAGWCPYSRGAKRLLDSKGVAYVEIDVDTDPALRREMMERAPGRYTVPQVFIDGRHVGGFDDLVALDDTGELDALLGATG